MQLFMLFVALKILILFMLMVLLTLIRDIETINLELIFSDIEILERRISKTVKAAKADKSLQKELDILEKLNKLLKMKMC